MPTPRNLLWVDGLAGLAVGLAMLLLGAWLQALYRLPRDLYLLVALANVTYGCYSLALASRQRRHRGLILLLIAANLAWALLCLQWAVRHVATASVFGVAHLVSEALFVAVLATTEWRWRERLLDR